MIYYTVGHIYVLDPAPFFPIKKKKKKKQQQKKNRMN